MGTRRENAKKMYEIMTRHYAYMFKGTITPFNKDWEQERHVHELGHDPRLVELLAEVKLAEEFHCKLPLRICSSEFGITFRIRP